MMFHQIYCPKEEMLIKRDDLFGHKQLNALSEHDYIWICRHQVN